MEEHTCQGLSIANNLLANNVQLNLNKNQESLKNIGYPTVVGSAHQQRFR